MPFFRLLSFFFFKCFFKRFFKCFFKFSFGALSSWSVLASFAILVLAGPLSQAADFFSPKPCTVLLRDPNIVPWRPGVEAPKLEAADLLPVAFLETIRSKLGVTPYVDSSRIDDVMAFEVRFSKKIPEFMRWKFILDPAHPQTVGIDALRLENPMYVPGTSRLHASQERTGLPMDVFRFAKERLLELARKGGFTKLTTPGSQNYLVSNLYRRMVGMKPIPGVSEKAFALLDSCYLYATRKLPPEERIGSIEGFNHVIGDYFETSTSERAQRFWNRYRATAREEVGFKLLKDDQDTVIGFLDQQAESRAARLYFINTLDTDRPILQYKALVTSGQLGLELDLTP
ncbi:MAG: hypothetical protein H7222_15235 [Methylotenera sp.]|nr:hypothetical protein [Oligoflexia bacterium]